MFRKIDIAYMARVDYSVTRSWFDTYSPFIEYEEHKKVMYYPEKTVFLFEAIKKLKEEKVQKNDFFRRLIDLGFNPVVNNSEEVEKYRNPYWESESVTAQLLKDKLARYEDRIRILELKNRKLELQLAKEISNNAE